jgi:hypothetical protein
MADGNFDERMNYLSDAVGHGNLELSVLVDQPYAQDQHENMSYVHPSGGQSHYLSEPFMANAFNFVDGLARAAITPTGSRLNDEMADIGGDLVDYVKRLAPVTQGHLRRSTSFTVTDQGVEIYHRPAEVPRDEDPGYGWYRRKGFID